MSLPALSVFGLNLAVVVACMLVLWSVSLRSGDPSFVDAFWPIGFVIIACLSAVVAHGDRVRTSVLLTLVAVWGGRLGGYLFWRWRRHGPDPRYVRLLAAAPGDRNLFSLRRVFLPQAVLMCLVSLPLQLGVGYAQPRGWTPQAILGFFVAGFGIAYETVADRQLTRFKADVANNGRVLDQGLWRFSRHPNYFGESLTWWGLFLVSVVNVPTLVGLVGPVLITAFLLKWSGIGPMERQLGARKPGYADYVLRTSAFVPLPPRRTVLSAPVSGLVP